MPAAPAEFIGPGGGRTTFDRGRDWSFAVRFWAEKKFWVCRLVKRKSVGKVCSGSSVCFFDAVFQLH